MVLSIQNQHGELVEPRLSNLLEIVDGTKEIHVNVLDTDPISGGIFVNVAKLINYGDHVKVIKKYGSLLGKIEIEETYRNIKPSEVLKMLFPNTFK